jgi:hypothetical protein
MTIWAVLSALFNALRIARLADYFWERHQARVKAQSVANTPTTRDELEKTLEKGDL